MNNNQILAAVHTPDAPAAIGPYSQAVKAGGMVYVSGQIPLDPATGAFAGADIRTQTRQCLKNLQAILTEAGSGLDKVVKTTVMLKDIGDFAAMNEVYAEAFTAPFPARAAFQVGGLPRDALVEIECVAICS